MAYQQAQIPVQKTAEFEQLRSALERIFSSPALEKFFGKMGSNNVPVREFERVLDKGLLEKVDSTLAAQGKSAKQLYQSLAVSDQALMREYYLERIEQVDPRVRDKFKKVYRYY